MVQEIGTGCSKTYAFNQRYPTFFGPKPLYEIFLCQKPHQTTFMPMLPIFFSYGSTAPFRVPRPPDFEVS
jgi:hypothetical protein